MENNLHLKVDKIQEDVSEIKVDIAEMKVIQYTNTESLKEHMKRTALAEAAIEDARKEAEQKFETLRETMEPIKNHVLLVNYTIVLIGSVATAILTVYGLYELFSRLL